MNELISLLALVGGFLFKKHLVGIRKILAKFLNRLIIPTVIIFNVINLNSTKVYISIWIVCLMLFLSLIASCFSKDRIKILCFAYINIGWLGIPIAHFFFNDTAVSFVVYAYIGSSLFGNLLSAFFLKSKADKDFYTLLKSSLNSPPVIAILLSIPLYFCREWINSHLQLVYQISKYIMSFTGLFILGSWLSTKDIKKKEIFQSLLKSLTKSLLIIVFAIPLLLLARATGNTLISNNIPTIVLLSLLPPAANIVILETYYRNTGKSAKIISVETFISIILLSIYILSYELIC